MNKQKSAVKIFSVILCLLMLVGICPDFEVITSAATPTKVSSISLEIDIPRPGATPDYEAYYDVHCKKTKRFDETDKMVNGVSWRYQKVNTSTTMKPTDTFVKGVQYTFSIVVQVKDGYIFDAADNYNSNVAAYVNGKRATVVAIHGDGFNAKNVLVINYTFDACNYSIIDLVKINNVKIPKAGNTVSFDAVPAGSGYIVSMVNWYDGPTTSSNMLAAGDVFQANREYTLEIFVRANDGCRLKTDADDYPAFTAKVNNVAATLIDSFTNDGRAAGFTITYSTGAVISEVSVSDIEIPRTGNTPDFSGTVDGVGYKILDVNGYEWEKQVFPYTSMSPDEKYEAGTAYRLLLRLEAEEGYTFDIQYAIIDDEQADVYYEVDTYCEIIYYFNIPADITTVDITGITAPVADGTADMTAETSSPDYVITDIEWKDTTTGAYKDYIYNITKFSEGREYTVDITVKPTGNNSFRSEEAYGIELPDITAKIDGKYAGVYSNDNGKNEAKIYYRFKTPVEKVIVTGLDEPVAGQTPDMTAESTKAGYEINKVEWYDNSVTPGVKLSATDKFIAGHNYTVQITLYACNDFFFNVEDGEQEITATINGKDAIEYLSESYGTAKIGYSVTVPVPHTHTPSDWKTDANQHWKVCTDSACGEITSAKENHKDLNGDEKCDTCAYPMPKPVASELLLKTDCQYIVSHKDKTVIIPVGTKISDVKANILNEKYAVLLKDGKAAADTTLTGTGMSIQVLGKDNAVLSTYKVVVLYDTDGNGVIQAADARLTLRASVNLESIKNEYLTASDINKSGKLEAADARSILRKSVGLD